ncbi:MAG: glycosyltransferase family 4 protein [Verrucomicrobia bacterium]|nr:glycosyltransferase family 4 protein [Verrucomicrobiota bacterium]
MQRYSRHLLEGLVEDPLVRVERVLLKNDHGLPADFSAPPQTRFTFAGSAGRALRTPFFAAELVGHGAWQKPDLVLTSHLNFSPAAHLLQRLRGVPFWTVAHGFEAWDAHRPSVLRALRACDRVLAVSSYTRQVLIDRHGLRPERVHLMPNTLDAERFRPRPKPLALLQRLGIDPRRRLLLTVARIEERERYKGYDQILRILPQVLTVVPEAHYLLVGRGNDLARVHEMIAQRGLGDRVTVATDVEDDELPDCYNACDVFVMPSKREGFGIVFLEALASGKPVIAGKVDGSVDPLLHGELGLLVDPDNAAEIRDAVVSVLLGTHSLAVLNEPEALRQRTIDHFGLAQFRRCLHQHFVDFFGISENTTTEGR